jgi:hypothetical protein
MRCPDFAWLHIVRDLAERHASVPAEEKQPDRELFDGLNIFRVSLS